MNIERRLLRISTTNLFGIQNPDEFSGIKTRQVDSQLGKYGEQFLLENPITVVLNEIPCGILAIIWDGHHRVRRAPRFGINKIPSYVYAPEELAVSTGQPLSHFIKWMETCRLEALEAFDHRLQLKGKKNDIQPITGLSLSTIVSVISTETALTPQLINNLAQANISVVENSRV